MLSAALRRLRCAPGFTLIELLVVLVLSVVVLGALFSLVDVALHQTQRQTARVDATSRARTTLDSILNELSSACTSAAAPVQAGSSDTSLMFTSAYGSAATPVPVQHQVTFNASTNQLTDTTSSGTKVLLTNVSQASGTPVFRYFSYQQPKNPSGSYYTDAGGNPYEMLLDGTTPVPGTNTIPPPSWLTTPLSATDAQSTAEVSITLSVGAAGGSPENTKLADTPNIASDSTVLRLTPAPNHASPNNSVGPCQ